MLKVNNKLIMPAIEKTSMSSYPTSILLDSSNQKNVQAAKSRLFSYDLKKAQIRKETVTSSMMPSNTLFSIQKSVHQ